MLGASEGDGDGAGIAGRTLTTGGGAVPSTVCTEHPVSSIARSTTIERGATGPFSRIGSSTPRLGAIVTRVETPNQSGSSALGPRFDDALVFASDLHREQRRKSTDVPYVSHLLGVASLVLEDGGSEDEAIAALLHDAVEDQGGAPTLERVRQRFGDEVARIVAACSDTDQDPKPPWRARKEAYLAHLEEADESVLRVSLADKLHNARAIARDLRTHGEPVWQRFSAGHEEQLWYYRALLDVFQRRSRSPMVHELAAMLRQLEGRSGAQRVGRGRAGGPEGGVEAGDPADE